MRAMGSAIIIAMLLISAIGGIAFAIGRLLFIESVSASYYANGAVAYYAAESGLEEGFLRYRYNRNAEVPFNTWTLGDSKVFRSNLSLNTPDDTVGSATFVGADKSAPLISTATMEQLYDLRMGYIGTNGSPWFGPADKTGSALGLDKADFISAGPTETYYVQKDDSLKIDLTGLDLSEDLVLKTKFFGVTTTGSANSLELCRALIEAKIVVQEENTTTHAIINLDEYKSLINYNRTQCASTLGISQNQMYSGVVTSDRSDLTSLFIEIPRLQSIVTENHAGLPAITTDPKYKISLFIKPLYYHAAIGLVKTVCTSTALCNNKANVISGPTTKIESIGYFGGTTRKLEADIDRQSGTLYDLFDYVIYKAN